MQGPSFSRKKFEWNNKPCPIKAAKTKKRETRAFVSTHFGHVYGFYYTHTFLFAAFPSRVNTTYIIPEHFFHVTCLVPIYYVYVCYYQYECYILTVRLLYTTDRLPIASHVYDTYHTCILSSTLEIQLTLGICFVSRYENMFFLGWKQQP